MLLRNHLQFHELILNKYRDYFGLYENGLKESVRDKLDTLSDREKKHLEQFLTQRSRDLDEE